MKPVDLEGLDIAILGTGREGKATWKYLRRLFPEKPLTLLSESPPESAFIAELTRFDHMLTVPLESAGLERFDLLIRSPGISVYRPELQRAVKAGVRITSPSNLWFAAHAQQRTICITGTKGKSTTAALLAHVLRAAGLRTQLAGNIGLPLLDCDEQDIDWWVIELSSHQLADLEARPSLSVILNLSPEHLDWHGSVSVYINDKLRLAELAGEAPLIANAADAQLIERLSGRQQVTWFNSDTGFHVNNGRVFNMAEAVPLHVPKELPGSHNLSNLAAVLTVARLTGISLDVAARAIRSFRGLPHRLQLAGERNGIRFINDSISSTPLATAAALESLKGDEVTLIIGGFDRGLDWAPYTAVFAEHPPRAVIAIPDNGSSLVEILKREGINPDRGFFLAEDLDKAVELARGMAQKGEVILLSPGAPSFPQFIDFRDRGRQFTRLCGFEPEEWDAW